MPYWSESDAITFSGAVSDAQETSFTEVSDRFISDVPVHFLQALQDEFGEKLHIVLDNAPYFASNQVKGFIEESQLKATYFPTGSPDLNPIEECWRQLKRSLGNRFFQN
jgi:transposase